jgi:hypothetical protein
MAASFGLDSSNLLRCSGYGIAISRQASGYDPLFVLSTVIDFAH